MDPNQSTPPPSQGSSLGGAESIMQRMAEFQASGGKEPEAQLPIEREEPKAPEKKETDKKLQSTEGDPKKVSDKSATPPKDPKATEDRGTDGMTKEQREVFLANKKGLEEAKTRIAELEQKSADRDITAKERDELKAWREAKEKEWAPLEKELDVVRLQKTPKYIQTITQPMQQLWNGVEAICKASDFNPGDILNAIENPNEVAGNAVISEMAEKLDSISSRKLERMVDDIRNLNRKANEMHANAAEAWAAEQAEQKAQKEVEENKSRETYSKAFDAVLDKFKKLDPSLVKENGELEDEVKAAVENARKEDFSKLPADLKAYFVQAGHILLVKNRQLKAKAEEIDRLQDSIAKLSKRPSIGDGGITRKDDAGETTSGESPAERWQKFVAGA